MIRELIFIIIIFFIELLNFTSLLFSPFKICITKYIFRDVLLIFVLVLARKIVP